MMCHNSTMMVNKSNSKTVVCKMMTSINNKTLMVRTSKRKLLRCKIQQRQKLLLLSPSLRQNQPRLMIMQLQPLSQRPTQKKLQMLKMLPIQQPNRKRRKLKNSEIDPINRRHIEKRL